VRERPAGRARRPAPPGIGLTWAAVALVGVRALVVGAVVLDPPTADPWLRRAETIASSPARPYRDFPLALGPLEAGAIRALGGDGVAATAGRLAVLALAADLAVAALLGRTWGRRVGVAYLAVGLPLVGVAYLRTDLVAVALAVGALAALRARADAGAGAVLGAAVGWKIWPLALLPALRHRPRALGWFSATLAVVGLAWYAWGGPRGPLQVLTGRGALGWSVESPIGAALWLVGRGATILEAGAIRFGVVPWWARPQHPLGLLATLAAIWRPALAGGAGAARDPRSARDPAALPALGATAALALFAPVAPVLHAAWLAPWVARCWDDADGRAAALLGTWAIALSGVLALRTGRWDALQVALALGRGALLLALVAATLRGQRFGSERAR
jgi:hypothetical protein